MAGQRPRHSVKLPAFGFGLVLLLLVAGADAGAQEVGAGSGRDGSREPTRAFLLEPETVGAIRLRPTTGPGDNQAREGWAIRARRETRSPAATPVKAEVRVPMQAEAVAPLVLQPVTGLPEAAPPQAPMQGPARAAALTPMVLHPVTGLRGARTPAPPPRRRFSEADPYGQIGYGVARMRLLPAIEQGIGYDDNPNRSAAPAKGSIVYRTEGEFRVKSEWSRHEFTGLLRGAYYDFASVGGADRAEGVGRLNLRLDAARNTQVDLEARSVLGAQRPGSPELNVPLLDWPLVSTFGATAGVTQRFNRLRLGLRGTVDRIVYEDARLASGPILDQSDRDQTEYGVRLRAGYELTPGLIPFVEGILDTRVFDQSLDNAGVARSSDGFAARVGSTFEVTRMLTGEAAAGYGLRKYDDPRLSDLHGALVDAVLALSATPLTTIRLRAASQIEDTTLAGSSGLLAHRATLEVQHDLRRNVSLIGAVTVSDADYRRASVREEGFAGSLKVDYRLTRALAVRGSFTHERLKSTVAGSNYAANVYLLGLRFQP